MNQLPKSRIPAAMIDRLLKGPASLAERCPFTHNEAQCNVTMDQADEVRKVLHRNYLLWLETWVIPELERLLSPEERAASELTRMTLNKVR